VVTHRSEDVESFTGIGGQASKAAPGCGRRIRSPGKGARHKGLGLSARVYRNVSIAMIAGNANTTSSLIPAGPRKAGPTETGLFEASVICNCSPVSVWGLFWGCPDAGNLCWSDLWV